MAEFNNIQLSKKPNEHIENMERKLFLILSVSTKEVRRRNILAAVKHAKSTFCRSCE